MNEKLTESKEPASYLKVKKFILEATNPITGATVTHNQECMMRGDSVAVMIYRPRDQKFIWVEQFRIGPGTKEPQQPTTIEPVAGMVDGDEDPVVAAKREVKEEARVDLLSIEKIGSFYMCPGVMNERMHLFFATVDDMDIKEFGGLESEHEFIKIHVWSADETRKAMEAGRMNTAQSMLLWQWAQLNPGKFGNSEMPLYLVRTKIGAALVRSESEMFAKVDVINSCYDVDANDLEVIELAADLAEFPNNVFEFKSFSDGTDQTP